MIMTEIRKDYIKITLIFYLGWIVIFIAEGLYANTLPTSDLTSEIDMRIPLLSGFVWFYVLCYIFPMVPLIVIQNWHRFNMALIAFAFCTLIAFLGHLLVPIAFPRPELGSSISDKFVYFIYLNDFRPGAQNFPSLHVSFALIIYLSCKHQGLRKYKEWLILLLSVLIILSTVFIKQHLFIDLLGGAILAIIIWSILQRHYYLQIDKSVDPRFALISYTKRILPYLYYYGIILTLIIIFQLYQNSSYFR
jgi:membrane-associated phospholipid phosphatase